MSAHHDHPGNTAAAIVRSTLVSIVGVVLIAGGVVMLALPNLLPFGGNSADETTIRNVLYGIFLIAAGLLLGVYVVLSQRRSARALAEGHQEAPPQGDGTIPADGGVVVSAAPPNNENVTTATGKSERTEAETHAEAATMGGTVIPHSCIIRIPRTVVETELHTSFDNGCSWLNADEISYSVLSTAFLIPTRQELFDYITSHFPAHTVMMSDHLSHGSGLPYFVNGGTHLYCAAVKHPQDMDRMLSTYNPTRPLACALVSGAMNLDSRASEEEQIRTIRESVIGFVCWHAERGEYIVVCGENNVL